MMNTKDACNTDTKDTKNNKNCKLIFLDIDGTLVGFDGKIPGSTVAAVKAAQTAGHKIFICTGRSRGIIYEYLLEFGFDGIVSSTGSMIEYRDKVIYKNTMSSMIFHKIRKNLEKANAVFIACLHSGCVMRKRDLPQIMQAWKDNTNCDNEEELGELFKSLDANIFDDDAEHYPDKYDDIVAVDYINANITVEELQKKLKPEIEVTTASFTVPSPYCGEITLGCDSKATAIDRICDYLDVPLEDTIAIGDSSNDEAMIRHAHFSVAMGNATPEIKEIADMVTDPVDKNGLANALIKLELID